MVKLNFQYIGLAPQQNNRAAIFYRAKIPARPCSVRNDATLGELHRNCHSCSTLVKYGMEMAALYPEFVTCGSCDNKVSLN